jgi:MFS family permease
VVNVRPTTPALLGNFHSCRYSFLICGFGYALDLAWAQAFGLIMPRVQAELGIADAEYGTVFAVFSAGLTAGALVWGMLVDVIGRRWAFNLTVAVQAVFGTALGALDSYAAIVVLTFGVGFGLGGNIPIDATITLEFLPQDSRYLLVALSVFQPLGGWTAGIFGGSVLMGCLQARS